MARACDIFVPASTAAWIDTGVILEEGDSLHLGATRDSIQVAPGVVAYPEGAYVDQDYTGFYPAGCAEAPAAVGLSGTPICSNVRPFGIVACLRADGVTPGATAGAVDDGLYVPLYSFHIYQQLREICGGDIAGYKLWVIVNDVAGGFAGNSGQFHFFASLRPGPPPNRTYSGNTAPTTVYAPG